MLVSRTFFYVEGLNLVRLINSLAEIGIGVYKVKVSKSQLIFAVPTASSSKVVDLLIKRCYTYKIIKSIGVSRLVSYALRNMVVVIGCFATIVCLFYCNLFIWKVNVCSTNTQLSEQVKTLLVDSGIASGCKVSSVSLDGIEDLIMSKINGVATAVVNIRGGTMNVSVYPSSEKIEIDNSPCDIVAMSDGQIVRMVVISGTPQVKVGDIVKRGQLLISGFTTFNDGSTKPIAAGGEIYATATSKGEAKFNSIIQATKRTGRFSLSTSIKLFNKVIDRPFNSKYSQYEVETNEAKLNLGFASLICNKIFETETVEQKVTIEQQMSWLSEQALNQALKNVLFEHTSIDYNIENRTDGTFVVATLSASINISTIKR